MAVINIHRVNKICKILLLFAVFCLFCGRVDRSPSIASVRAPDSSFLAHPSHSVLPDLMIFQSVNNNTLFQSYYAIELQTPVGHAWMHPCPSLFDSSITMLWSRPRNTIPFRPRYSGSFSCIMVALLLLSGDVECNPGPSCQPTSLRFGYINICSAVHKTALIHDILTDHSLDVLAISETRFRSVIFIIFILAISIFQVFKKCFVIFSE